MGPEDNRSPILGLPPTHHFWNKRQNDNYMNLLKKALFTVCALCCGMLYAQQTPVTKANYELAERFSPKKIGKMVFSTKVQPNYFKNSNKFWYSYTTSSGTEYYIVDPSAGTKRKLWDMAELAARVTEITKDPFDAQHLPINSLELVDDKYFTFEIKSSLMVPKKDKEDGNNAKKGAKENKVFKFKYDIASGKLTDISEEEKKDDYPGWARFSPDGKYAVYVKKYNLWYMDAENLKKAAKDEKDSTIVEHQLTTDGTADFPYGGSYADPYATEKELEKSVPVQLAWSHE